MSKLAFGFVFLSFLVLGCGAKQDQKETAHEEEVQANEYPDVVLTMADGKELPMRTLTGKNIFVFFQPDCRHCQIEAINIEERIESFKDYTIYFISSADMGAIEAFAESFELDNKNNVKFAWASTQSVLDNYGPIRTPSLYIYVDGMLKEHFNGQTDIQNIIDAL